MSRLTIRISEELQSELGSLARQVGKSESQVVREALAEYLQKHGGQPSCFDLARDLGLIGCVNSGESDLSTNPAHLEGFGRD